MMKEMINNFRFGGGGILILLYSYVLNSNRKEVNPFLPVETLILAQALGGFLNEAEFLKEKQTKKIRISK